MCAYLVTVNKWQRPFSPWSAWIPSHQPIGKDALKLRSHAPSGDETRVLGAAPPQGWPASPHKSGDAGTLHMWNDFQSQNGLMGTFRWSENERERWGSQVWRYVMWSIRKLVFPLCGFFDDSASFSCPSFSAPLHLFFFCFFSPLIFLVQSHSAEVNTICLPAVASTSGSWVVKMPEANAQVKKGKGGWMIDWGEGRLMIAGDEKTSRLTTRLKASRRGSFPQIPVRARSAGWFDRFPPCWSLVLSFPSLSSLP